MIEEFLVQKITHTHEEKYKAYIGSIPITKEYRSKGWVIRTLINAYRNFAGVQGWQFSRRWVPLDKKVAKDEITKLVDKGIIKISKTVPFCNSKLSRLLTSADHGSRVLGINFLMNEALQTEETSEDSQEENNKPS